MADLGEVESRLRSLLEPYRDVLEESTIYGLRALKWPSATADDFFVAVGPGKGGVTLVIPALEDSAALEGASAALLGCRSAREAFTFTSLDDALARDVGALLARVFERDPLKPPPASAPRRRAILVELPRTVLDVSPILNLIGQDLVAESLFETLMCSAESLSDENDRSALEQVVADGIEHGIGRASLDEYDPSDPEPDAHVDRRPLAARIRSRRPQIVDALGKLRPYPDCARAVEALASRDIRVTALPLVGSAGTLRLLSTAGLGMIRTLPLPDVSGRNVAWPLRQLYVRAAAEIALESQLMAVISAPIATSLNLYAARGTRASVISVERPPRSSPRASAATGPDRRGHPDLQSALSSLVLPHAEA